MPRTRQRFYPEELKAEIRARHAAGETIPDLARKTGLSFTSVKSICGRELARREAATLAQAQEETGQLF